MVGPAMFQIPNTPTLITLGLTGPVSPRANLNLLNATARFISNQLEASGDSQLPPSREPFIYDLEQGMFLNATSWTDQGEHLTWSMLNNTLGWLIPHLAPISKFRQGGVLWINDAKWGPVGIITFEAGYSGANLPTILPGALGQYTWPKGH